MTEKNTASTNFNEPVVTPGESGGQHVTDGPLTTPMVRAAAPGLLRNDIDKRVARVRPMSTPVDQISRMIGARRAGSMVVEYYSVDTKAQTCTCIAPVEETGEKNPDGFTIYSMTVDHQGVIAPTDTLMVPEMKNGDGNPLTLYVADRGETRNSYRVIALNGSAGTDGDGLIEGDIRGMKLVRMGRAASELDVQTSQFEALPRKASNYCQIFKAQVEQGTFTRLAAKEVGWTFSDQEEVAVMDMRLGMEKSFLFGVKGRVQTADGTDEVLFTQGIWNQAETEFSYTAGSFGQDTLIDLMRLAFTGDRAGSRRKILVAGSELIARINKLDYTKMISARDTVTRWGIDFNELRSKFGTLYVIHSEVFDQCCHADDGLVLDPEYLVKYVHVPFTVERIDLKSSGVRNTEAVVVTEASCMALRHPKSHVRITLGK